MLQLSIIFASVKHNIVMLSVSPSQLTMTWGSSYQRCPYQTTELITSTPNVFTFTCRTYKRRDLPSTPKRAIGFADCTQRSTAERKSCCKHSQWSCHLPSIPPLEPYKSLSYFLQNLSRMCNLTNSLHSRNRSLTSFSKFKFFRALFAFNKLTKTYNKIQKPINTAFRAMITFSCDHHVISI